MHLLDVGGNLPVRLYMEWRFWQLCGHYPKVLPQPHWQGSFTPRDNAALTPLI